MQLYDIYLSIWRHNASVKIQTNTEKQLDQPPDANKSPDHIPEQLNNDYCNCLITRPLHEIQPNFAVIASAYLNWIAMHTSNTTSAQLSTHSDMFSQLWQIHHHIACT